MTSCLPGAPSETLFSASGEYKLFDNLSERASLEREMRSAQPIAPQFNITGGRRQLRSRLRSGFALLVDRRTDFDKLRDRLEDRAERMKSAA